MQNKEKIIPFGLLFEEVAESPQVMITPIYDDTLDLSMVKDETGQLVPLVDLGFRVGTDTTTAAVTESTDTDPQDDQVRKNAWGSLMATDTVTRRAAEATDKD